MVDLRTISFPIYTHLSDPSLHRKTNKDILTTDTKYRLNYAWIQKNKDTQGNTKYHNYENKDQGTFKVPFV